MSAAPAEQSAASLSLEAIQAKIGGTILEEYERDRVLSHISLPGCGSIAVQVILDSAAADGVRVHCTRHQLAAEDFVREKIGLPRRQRANDNEPSAARPKMYPTVITAAELQHKKFEPMKWIVPGYIAEGFTLLSGRPKIGKSWLNLDLGLGVARGTTCLGGIPCEQGDVLYMALEDNERRLQSRINKLTAVTVTPGSTAIGCEPWPVNLYLVQEWPRADVGGLKQLEAWLDEHPTTRLVIVDVIAMFRAAATRATAYEQDYACIKGLQGIASRRCIGIVGTHHNRKSASESGDSFDLVSGTLGLTGAADAALILDRTGLGTTLYVRGRDVEEREAAVTFDKLTCKWRVLGPAAEVRRSDERKSILDFLLEADEPATIRTIAVGTGRNEKAVERLIGKMVKADEVERQSRGLYLHPSRTDLKKPTNPSGRSSRKVGIELEGEVAA